MKTKKITVMTFKKSGKFYEEWTKEIETNAEHWYQVIKEVRHLKESKQLPQYEMTYVLTDKDNEDIGYPHLIA